MQCEQFTQDTAHIEKANTDFNILIPPFNLSTAEYYHTMFLRSLNPNMIKKLGRTAIRLSKNNPQLKYIIINE